MYILNKGRAKKIIEGKEDSEFTKGAGDSEVQTYRLNKYEKD